MDPNPSKWTVFQGVDYGRPCWWAECPEGIWLGTGKCRCNHFDTWRGAMDYVQRKIAEARVAWIYQDWAP